MIYFTLLHFYLYVFWYLFLLVLLYTTYGNRKLLLKKYNYINKIDNDLQYVETTETPRLFSF